MAIKSLFAVLGTMGALIVSSEAHATTCTSSTCTGTVKKIVLNTVANTPPQPPPPQPPIPLMNSVELDQDIAPTGGCTLQGGKYWLLKASETDIMKTLVSAYLAGKPVGLRKDDSQTTCTIIYASLE